MLWNQKDKVPNSLAGWSGLLMSAIYSPASLPSFLRVLKAHLFSRNFRIKEWIVLGVNSPSLRCQSLSSPEPGLSESLSRRCYGSRDTPLCIWSWFCMRLSWGHHTCSHQSLHLKFLPRILDPAQSSPLPHCLKRCSRLCVGVGDCSGQTGKGRGRAGWW